MRWWLRGQHSGVVGLSFGDTTVELQVGSALGPRMLTPTPTCWDVASASCYPGREEFWSVVASAKFPSRWEGEAGTWVGSQPGSPVPCLGLSS